MRTFKLFVLGGLSALALTGSAAAGDYCGANCYRKVVTPPQYATVAETVQVRPASVARHVTPAEYGTVHEHVVVRPARTVAHVSPAEYGTVAETVMVSPGGKRWQVTRDAYGNEVGCWVNTPPQYAVRHRTVQVRAASVHHAVIPAVTAVRARTVMTRPAQVHEEVIPAQYATRHHTVQVSPGYAAWQPIGRSW